MPDPKFKNADGLASIVLIGNLIDKLVEVEVLEAANKQSIVNESLMHLDLMGTKQGRKAYNLILDAIGAPGRKRR